MIKIKKGPDVSVVMPSFNCSRYIQKSIKSILEQTFTDFELIIINDGSSDDTESNLREFIGDKRVKYFKLNKNRGNYVSRNLGMREANGKYIAVMDADDISDKDRLSKQVNYLESHYSVGCVGSQGYFIDEFDNTISDLNKPVQIDELKIFLLMNNYTLHPSLMFRRSSLKKYNLEYNEHLEYASDYEFVVRCSWNFKLVNMPERLIYYRCHNSQISTTKMKEQIKTANHVREMQIRKLGIDLSSHKQILYNRLMQGKLLDRADIFYCAEILDEILEKNEKLKAFKRAKLYSFFESIIRQSFSRI